MRNFRAVTLVLLALAGLLTACGYPPPRPAAPVPTPESTAGPLGARLVTDFSGSGPLPPEFRIIDRGRSTAPVSINDGVLTHGDPTGPDAAVYILAPPQTVPVTRIGAIADFTSDAGSIALLVSEAPVPDDPAAAAPNASVHFVADARRWTYGLWVAGARSQTVIAEGAFTRSFDLHDAAFEIRLRGDQAVVHLPDATAVTLTDPRIAEFSGGYAAWELFEAGTQLTSAGFRTIWAN